MLPYFKIPGLMPEKRYKMTVYGGEMEETRSLTGHGAATVGVRVDLFGDFDGRILHFEAK
jgi:hypothetical protein